MNPPDLKHIPRVVKGYIRDLEERATQDIAQRDAQIEELNRRIEQLEEQIRLLQSERFAPKSEKRKDRVFDEAEQIAQTEPSDEEDEGAQPALPDTGLPKNNEPERRKGGRKPLPVGGDKWNERPHLPGGRR